MSKLRFTLPFARPRPADAGQRSAGPVTPVFRGYDHGLHPLVHPLVVGGSHYAWTETPMPPRALVHCREQNAYFHGLCGQVGGTRLIVRAAALRGLDHAASRTDGKDAAGAAWDGRHKALYAAVADGRNSVGGSAHSARQAVQHVLALAEGQAESDLPDAKTAPIAAIVRPRAKGATIEVHGGGDGQAWLLTRDGWHPLRPDTSVKHAPPGSVVVLGTDGFAGALDSPVNLGAELAVRWRTPPTPLEFVAHLDFFDGLRTDDRAAVAIWIG